MAAVLLRLRTGARSRWRAWVALALLVGVAGGIILAALAGAERTETSYDRFLRWSNASDLVLFNAADPVDFEQVRALPEVDEALDAWFAWMVDTEAGHSVLDPVFAAGRGLEVVDRPKVLAGRRPDPTKVDEASITPVAARLTGLGVGDTVTLDSLAPQQLEQAFEGEDLEPEGPTFTFRIVGIEASAGGFIHDAGLVLTPAFGRAHGDEVATVPLLAVKLRRGAADLGAFKAGVERIAGGSPVNFDASSEGAAETNRTLRIQAVALRLFAALGGLAALVILAQALAREASGEAVDHPALRAVGMTRLQLWATSVLRVAAIAVAGATVAVAVAVVASPPMVFGLAEEVEPHPGAWFDASAVLGGAAALALLTVAAGAWPAWRATRSVGDGEQAPAGAARAPSMAVACAARAGLSASAVAGVRMALEPGRGRSAVPTRAALVGTSLSLIAVLTAFCFGSSLSKLLSTPRLYGWDWDAVVGSPFDADTSAKVVPALAAGPAVSGFSSVSYAEVEMGDVRVRALGFDTVQGSVLPPIVEGRAPGGPDEIVLGTKTVEDVDRSVGDTVDVRVGDERASMRIVGRGVFPAMGESDEGALGEGALLTRAGLVRLVPEAPVNLFAVRFSDDVPHAEATRFVEDLGFGVTLAEPPKAVADFGRVDRLPAVLSTLLVVIAAGTLGHTLLMGVRRRRRDLAILKSLGFVRRQVGAVVAWQATTLVVLALACAVPLGVAAGRTAWRVFADELGIVPQPVVPAFAILAVVPATVVVANVLAAIPGRAAARTRPALVLRSE